MLVTQPPRGKGWVHEIKFDGYRLLTGGQSYRNTGNIAIELRRRSEFTRAKLTELSATDAKAWAQESVTIARDVVYAGGTLKGGMDRSDGPVLSDG